MNVSAQRMFNISALSETVSGPGFAVTVPQHVSARGSRAFVVTDAGYREKNRTCEEIIRRVAAGTHAKPSRT